MNTRSAGASSNAVAGMFSVEANTDFEPPAIHSLSSTVVKSAWLWITIT